MIQIRYLKLKDGTYLVRSFLPVEDGGSGVIEYYIGVEKSLITGVEKMQDISPKLAFEIASEYRKTKAGRDFIKEIGNV